MIKAVLFDLDGTLLDRETSVKKFISDQYDRLDSFLNFIPKQQYVSRFLDLEQHGYVWKDQVYQEMVNEFGILHLTWEDFLKDYMSRFKEYCVPFPGLQKMLRSLTSNYKLGLITNGRENFQLATIQALGIEPFFDCLLISETEGTKKPNPEIFERALQKLSCSPSESVFVGDHLINDVKAAQAIGMTGIWKKNALWEDARAEYTIEDLADIPGIIESLK